jgi:predicted Ser/Thr protein kinase
VTNAVPKSASPTAAPKTPLGRYVLLEKLGEGGMGAVFAAHDPMLNRKVAIKVLRRQLSHPAYGARMVREAQSLAKLSHPNVVSVHDVGFADGQMFLAMEHIDGRALSQVIVDSLAPAQVLELFLAAGEGLRAAHDVGLVHRDFKPHNVMVGSDGRVRVLDFGLARDSGEVETTTDASVTPPLLLGAALTQEGAVMGTPGYMSPEQHAGQPCDARSDQFSFCVSLWEGLYGELPSRLSAEAETRDAKGPPRPLTGWRELEATPKHKSVSQRIHEALLRGMRLSRAERFPSMRELLEALRPRPRRYPISLVYGLAVVTALISAAVVVEQFNQRTPKGWWARHRASCNPVRGTSVLQEARAPAGPLHEGGPTADLYTAACLALAGEFTQAAPLAAALPAAQREEAAHLFYLLGAPRDATAASRLAGSQREMLELSLANSTAPTEERLRATYFVALAEVEDGELDAAKQHLMYFLAHAVTDDAWRQTALAAVPP